MTRPRSEWKIKDRSLVIGERTLIMGVLNVTPDSFSDGGKYSDPDRAYARAVELEEQGADIIDIGAESTKPGSTRVSEAEELRRLIPVLKRLQDKLSIPISVDTYKAGVAEKAFEYGVAIVNDPSGLTWDPALAKVAVKEGAGLVLNHMRGTPETWGKLPPLPDVMATIRTELEATVNRARHAGVDKDRIVVDPGLGFGKRKEQNSDILARLGDLRSLLVPILVGPSRKAFLNQTDETYLEFATAAAVTAAVLNGAAIVRVHDVLAAKAVLQVVDAIAESAQEIAEKPERKEREAEQREPAPRKSRTFSVPSGAEERPARTPAPTTERPAATGEPPARNKPIFERAPRKDDASEETARPPRPYKRTPPTDDRDQAAAPPRRTYDRPSRSSDDRRPPRDDRSGPPSRPYGRPPGRSDDRPRRDDGGDRPARPYGRPPGDRNRPDDRNRGDESRDRPPRPFGRPPGRTSGDRDDRGGSAGRPTRPYGRPLSGDREDRGGSAGRPTRPYGRPPSGDREDRGGSAGRPPRPFGRPPSGDRPSRDDGPPRKRSFGPPRKQEGDRPRPPAGRPYGRDDRRSGPSGPPSRGRDDRRPSGGDDRRGPKPSGGPKRPPRKS